jgi:hypothetical protein
MARNGIVPAPKVEPALYGLLSVADVVNHGASDEHWIQDISWLSEICAYGVEIVDICDPSVGMEVKDVTSTEPVTAPAFGIDVTDECTTTFGMDLDERRKRMTRAIEAISGHAVEAALWNGYGTGDEEYPAFANSSPTILSSTAVTAVQGLALLENAIDCGMGVRGTVHATRGVVSNLATVLRNEGDTLQTRLGTYVAAGTGYGDVGPAGETTAAGAGWMYGTGPLVVHLGPIIIYDTPEISTNDVIMKAERPASVAWDRCCLYAVKVTL